jgi:hypothetical protein
VNDVNYKFRMLGLVLLLGSVAMLPLAKADEWNHETTVTLIGPVEVPGRVLPAGEYVFKLADSQTNRNIVQILNEDQSQIITTVLTVPAQRTEPTFNIVMTLQERSNGSPEALGTWYFAGQLDGVEFLYHR